MRGCFLCCAGHVGSRGLKLRRAGRDRVDHAFHIVGHGDPRSHNRPAQHRAQIGAVLIRDRGDFQIQGFLAQADISLVEQVARIGQHLTLVRRVLMEDVDAGADQLIGVDRQLVFDRADRVDRRLIGVVDLEVFEVGRHHVDR